MQYKSYKVEVVLSANDGERVPFEVNFHAENDKLAAVKAMALAEGVAKSGSWPPMIQGYLFDARGARVGSFDKRAANTKCSFTWAQLKVDHVVSLAREVAQGCDHNHDILLAAVLLQALGPGLDRQGVLQLLTHAEQEITK